jgi:hypothetical protein
MTSDRANAYGRVVATIDDVGAAKLQPPEVDRVREAADTLLFAEDLRDDAARAALEDIEALTEHLAESGRWTEERARRLFEDVAECGPIAHVG